MVLASNAAFPQSPKPTKMALWTCYYGSVDSKFSIGIFTSFESNGERESELETQPRLLSIIVFYNDISIKYKHPHFRQSCSSYHPRFCTLPAS
mmetsp:Transcript_17456/g.42833  ORF Transcript_17456/g.42833 Transcript_17456/m.42833 type:complete len:93 (-) Transcript_17456:3704-3982(-)